MNETAKKALLVVVAIAALVVAGFGAKRLFSGDQPEVIRSIPADPNFKSEKQLAIEAQQGAAASGGERDLSGALTGGG